MSYIIEITLLVLLGCVWYINCTDNHKLLIGRNVTVFIYLYDDIYLCYLGVPTYTEIKCKSKEHLKVGDTRVIEAYKNGIYYLS